MAVQDEDLVVRLRRVPVLKRAAVEAIRVQRITGCADPEHVF